MAPSLVQSASGTATTGTTITVTLGSATTAGNCLVVKAGTSQSTTAPTVSGITLGGSAGNFVLAKAGSVSTADCEIWTDQSCAGGQTSVVVTVTGGVGTQLTMAAIAEEWTGIAASGAVDKTNSGATSGITWSSGSSGTLTSAQEVIVGAVYSINPGASFTTPGAPWTELAQVTVTNTITSKLAAGWQIVTATTAQTYNGTQTNVAANAAVIVSLLESPPPGTVQPPATIPVPRRRPARALWARGSGQPRPLPPRGGWLVARTVPSAAVWGGIAVSNVPRLPPRGGWLVARTVPSAAVWGGITAFSNVPAPPGGQVSGLLRTADYDGKSWWKKRWILRL